MSMHTTITYGYGIDKMILSKIDKEKYHAFIRKHTPEYAENLSADELENKLINDTNECGDTSYFNQLWRIMSDKEGLDRLTLCQDEDGETYIMFVESMPWSYSDSKELASEKDATNIFLKYLKELLPDDKYMSAHNYISYQACENFG